MASPGKGSWPPKGVAWPLSRTAGLESACYATTYSVAYMQIGMYSDDTSYW